VDILQIRNILQLRTSVLFGAKNSGFSKFMMCLHGQGGGLSQCGQRRRCSTFRSFVRTSLWTALIENTVIFAVIEVLALHKQLRFMSKKLKSLFCPVLSKQQSRYVVDELHPLRNWRILSFPVDSLISYHLICCLFEASKSRAL